MVTKYRNSLQPVNPLATEPEITESILTAAGVLLVILDAGGRIVHFNAACEKATGYTDDEMIGQHVWDRLLDPEEVDDVKAVFHGLVQLPNPNEYENYWVAKNGKRICIHWFNTSIRDSTGTVRWIIGSGLDVTEKKRVQQMLEEQAAKLQAVVETAIEGIITIDENGTIESLNPAAERMFGYNEEELIGQKVKMLMPHPYREQHQKYIDRYLRTGDARIIGLGREAMGRRSDGSSFPLELAISEVVLPRKRLFTGIIRDISDRRSAEKRERQQLAEHAHAARLAALGEMASGIAHELNQPLAAIVSFADACLNLVKKEEVPEEVIVDTLRQISEQGLRAGDMIRRLRQFVKTGALDREIVNLNAVINDMLAMVRHEILMNEIEVKLRLQHYLPSVWADKLQIEQVVLNILRNAIEAMETSDTSVLHIETSKNDEKICVRISDTGCGLADSADKLFKPFYTTKEKGTGLGLSISDTIIEAHDGEISAESRVDGGATFTFRLPIAEAIYE